MIGPKSLRSREHLYAKFRAASASFPLICALLAPLSTLLDIPALTEKWYDLDDELQPDPKASLVLSAVGLALNLVANALLLVRFSAKQRRWWSAATTCSTIAWVTKTVVAVVNLIVFGALTRNKSGYSYTEAFFCAIASVCLAGIISILLLLHYANNFARSSPGSGLEVRITGRQFMLSITILVFVIGVQALIYQECEQWGYFNSIYFCVVTMLTIGFGDYAPTTTATKVLLLPFAILTISQLGNQVSMIVNYFSERSEDRRKRWRKRYETVARNEAKQRNPRANLKEELQLVADIAKHEEMIGQYYDLCWSIGGLTAFWVVGAAIFQAIEGWSYGNAFYFNIVFNLTIGYGDFSPETPGGRVFFVLYSIASVPLIASFAVQSVTGVLSTLTDWRQKKRVQERNKMFESTAFKAHRDFVLQHRRTWLKMMEERQQGRTMTQSSDDTVDEREAQVEDESRRSEERELISEVIHQAVKLEAISRRMLVDYMPKGSLAQMLLVADRNVQIRDVDAVGGDAHKLENLWKEERDAEDEARSTGDDTLEQIRRYRETFALLLVAGTRLQKLEGEDVYRFERRRNDDHLDGIEQSGESTESSDEKLSPIDRARERKRLLEAMLREEDKDRQDDDRQAATKA